MLYTLSPDQMQQLEADFMIATGYPSLLLMEHAAQGVCNCIQQMLISPVAPVLFLCGPGNNGGDGFAAARLHVQQGGNALVWRLPGKLSGDSETNLHLLETLYPHTKVVSIADALPPIPKDTGLIVDALFGTGLCRPLEGTALEMVNAANESGIPILAVDIPSGLSGNTGYPMGNAVTASETVTFHRPKDGLYLHQGPNHTGKITIIDIGIPPSFPSPNRWEIALCQDLPALVPPRKPVSHKGTYGKVLILAGSIGMAGAAAICAQAALKAGAGLCTVALMPDILPIVQSLVPCATCIPLPAQNNVFLPEAAANLAKAAAGADCIAVGPGLGNSIDRLPLLKAIKEAGKPCVWDADALNLLASHPALLPLSPQDICTPHPGEAARLLNTGTAQVLHHAPTALHQLSQKLGAVTILKGATTLIRDGEKLAMNITGTPAMAKGGSGDALTGIIAALLCRLPSFKAAQAGCLIHGMAGIAAAKATGENGLTAWELTQHIGISMGLG